MDEIHELANIVQNIEGPYQVMALFMVCAVAVLSLWIIKISGNSKKLIDAKEESEIERTKLRKLERDTQYSDLDKRINEAIKESKGVGTSLDKHIEKHSTQDMEVFGRLGAIEKGQIDKGEFSILQRDVHEIEKTVVEIHTIVKHNFKI